ncbi:TRAP transporter substrate-binding protein DctP [Pararhodobacter sp. CCB-MM2]|uniref:TRAP transporter substrate-binding protein DctP n=1 Tax=Pararhodobacter sp. CCB-MM2 TaxID=1786003 RepID=UPI00082B5525|nr:TRAP transporter substrate-binding protein DctP [Pararhodobacter sp. CCB-MM2]
MTILTKTLSLAATLALTTGAAQAVDMRCSHQLPPAHAVAQVIDRWAAEVERLSDGEIDVQIFGADSLVGAGENITSVARGDIECAFSVQFQWGRTLPIMTVTTAPYAFADMNIWRNWDGSAAANFLEDRLRERGVENVVWLFQTNDSVFTSNDHLLAAPEDFAGMRLRGLTPAFDASLAALGAAPTAMPGSEVYQALATGTLDGAITGTDAAVSRRYYEVQDYFTVVPVISVFFHGYVNPGFYAGLSDTARAALDEAGSAAAGWAVEAAEAGMAQAVDDLRAHDVTVEVLTDEQNAALEAVMRPAFDAAFGSEVEGAAELLGLIDQLRSAN